MRWYWRKQVFVLFRLNNPLPCSSYLILICPYVVILPQHSLLLLLVKWLENRKRKSWLSILLLAFVLPLNDKQAIRVHIDVLQKALLQRKFVGLDYVSVSHRGANCVYFLPIQWVRGAVPPLWSRDWLNFVKWILHSFSFALLGFKKSFLVTPNFLCMCTALSSRGNPFYNSEMESTCLSFFKSWIKNWISDFISFCDPGRSQCYWKLGIE